MSVIADSETWWRPSAPRWPMDTAGLAAALARAVERADPPDVGAPSSGAGGFAGDPGGASWIAAVVEALPSAGTARRDVLDRVRRAHDTPRSALAGVPPRLWDRWLEATGRRLPPGSPRWVDGGEAGPPHGVARGDTTAWWGRADRPGRAYAERLWAWGAVEPGATALDPGATSARRAWTARDGRWVPARGLDGAPRWADGPGLLLAAIVDAIATVVRSGRSTGRDRAVLWGAHVLPLVAPSALVDGPAAETAAPDFAREWAFHLLHPRAQAMLAGLEGLCTLLTAGDDARLAEVLAAVPWPADPPRAEAWALIADIGRRAGRRDAAARWDSGFGFRLVRGVLRDVLPAGPAGFEGSWDARLHAPAADSPELGRLAGQLRDAANTALAFRGRPAYPGGPVARQLVDLTWLRWTDPLFLR